MVACHLVTWEGTDWSLYCEVGCECVNFKAVHLGVILSTRIILLETGNIIALKNNFSKQHALFGYIGCRLLKNQTKLSDGSLAKIDMADSGEMFLVCLYFILRI